jgi:FkbM family methyltransferase
MTFISYAQNFEDVMLWRALKDIKNGFYIDIGSERPFADSVSYGFSLKGWQGISVEVNPQYYQEFKKNRPYDRIVQALISDQYEKLKFYVFKDTGLSTADENFAKIHIDNGLPYEILEVDSMRLDDIFNSSLQKDIHWLKIDVEGFEKKVLNGWDGNFRPWILVIEAMLPNVQISTHREWEYILSDKGYQFVYADGLNRFYVSQEHENLKKHFQYPPNPLQDDYISISHHNIGAITHRALQAEKQLCEKEAHAAALDLEIIKKESSLNKANDWAKELEKQVFVQQEYLENRDQRILELSKRIEEYNTWINSLEATCDAHEKRFIDAEQLIFETKALALENEQKLFAAQERAIQAEALALENEQKLFTAQERAIQAEALALENEQKLFAAQERAAQVEALALENEQKLFAAQEHAAQAEALVLEIQKKIIYLEKLLDGIYKSRSWKITRALRQTNLILQNFTLFLEEKIKNFLKRAFKTLFNKAYKNPKLKNFLLITEKILPNNIRSRVRAFYSFTLYQKNSSSYEDSKESTEFGRNLTSREKEIYTYFMGKKTEK